MRFSERYGYKPVREIIQKESMDDELKNRVWSCLYNHFFDMYQSSYTYQIYYAPKIKLLWQNYFKKPIDTLPSSPFDATEQFRKFFNSSKWYEIYDLIEEIIKIYPQLSQFKPTFLNELNTILEEEKSAYRIVNAEVIEITSEQEIQSIEQALENTNPYSGVQQHLNQSLKLMSDRQNPDYRNSIKESISAVESICKIVTNDEKATLGKALKIVEDKFGLHPALKGSLSQLYGYTSDADGIRHAMLEESNLSYIDAKFMLVACSNFINYLIEKTK